MTQRRVENTLHTLAHFRQYRLNDEHLFEHLFFTILSHNSACQ